MTNTDQPAASRRSPTTWLLSLALAATTTAAVIFAVLYFRSPAPVNAPGNAPEAANRGIEPHAQKGTVSPQKQKVRYAGVVYYEWPYASTPSLKLTASKRLYDVIKEDEFGFTWYARYTLEDVTEETRKLVEKKIGPGMTAADLLQTIGVALNPGAEFEDFTWEAKGMPAAKGVLPMRIYSQEGTFPTAETEGMVNFQIPYATAPNVELSTNDRRIAVVESRPTGFKWKFTGPGSPDNHPIQWTAKGIRAAEIPKGP
jgi:hypothetical protein